MTKDELKNFSLAQANWWTAYSNSRANKSRKVYVSVRNGYDEHEELLSEEELVDDALNTAKQHLDNFLKLCEGIEL
jgi:hypothetical protein